MASPLHRQMRQETTTIGILEKICYAAIVAVAVLWSLYVIYALVYSVIQVGLPQG